MSRHRKRVDCRRDYRFQVDVFAPDANGNQAPALTGVSTVVFHLAASKAGAAIDPAVDTIAAAQTAGDAARWYADVDGSGLATHVLGTVGHGGRFWLVPTVNGEEQESIEFEARDGNL